MNNKNCKLIIGDECKIRKGHSHYLKCTHKKQFHHIKWVLPFVSPNPPFFTVSFELININKVFDAHLGDTWHYRTTTDIHTRRALKRPRALMRQQHSDLNPEGGTYRTTGVIFSCLRNNHGIAKNQFSFHLFIFFYSTKQKTINIITIVLKKIEKFNLI